MAKDIVSQLDMIASEQKNKCERYRAMLPRTGDVALVILKGHLIIEELLFQIAITHCVAPDEFKKAKLSFAQLLHITHSLVRLPVPEQTWQAINSLNGIRNALVHNLDPKEIDKKIVALNHICICDTQFPDGYVAPTEIAEIAAGVISYIMGSLTVVGTVAAFIESNLKLSE